MNDFESDWICLSQSFVQNGLIQDGRIQHGRIQDGFHHYIKSEWISLSQSFVQNDWIQDGRIQDGCHQQINQIELGWIRVRVQLECFWVNPTEDNKVSESKMAVFKMAAIIKLSQNEWVKFFYVQMVGTNLGKCEWVWEEILKWLNPRWPNSWWWNSRWLPSSS